MITIVAPRRITDNFGDGFDKLFPIMEQIGKLAPEEAIIIDMHQCLLLTPFFLLPFFLLLQKETAHRVVTIQTREGDYNFTGYLKDIYFSPSFKGFEPENYANKGYTAFLETYADKTYIPIINFPARRGENSTEIRDHLLSCVIYWQNN